MDPFPVPSLLLRVMHVQVKGPGSRAYKRFVAARIIQRWIKKYVSMSAACWFTLRAHASRLLHMRGISPLHREHGSMKGSGEGQTYCERLGEGCTQRRG